MSIDFNLFTNYWDDIEITKSKATSLESINISDISKSFLLEVGIPKKLELFCDFSFNLHEDHLPSLESLFGDILAAQGKLDQFFVIGFADDDPICLSADNGSVLSFHIDFAEPFCFLNNSIEQFAQFLVRYQQHQQRAENENLYNNDQKYHQITKSLEIELKSIDPDALNDGNWWAEIIEQIYDGLI